MIALLLALALQTPPDHAMPSIRTVAKGSMSHVDAPREEIVRTADAWATLWKAHDPDSQAPDVDFSKEMVVGVFLGTRPTSGFGVEISEVLEKGNALIVRYREKRPPPGVMTAQVLTSPFHLVVLPRRTGDVTFEKID